MIRYRSIIAATWYWTKAYRSLAEWYLRRPDDFAVGLLSAILTTDRRARQMNSSKYADSLRERSTSCGLPCT